jgi:hypothetical protein
MKSLIPLFMAALILLQILSAEALSAQDSTPVMMNKEKPVPSTKDVRNDIKPKSGEESKEAPLNPRVPAREPLYDGNPIVVSVPVSRNGSALVTVVQIPEESIKTILVHLDNEELSLEQNGSKIFIKLLKRCEGFLDVLGESDTLYRLLLKPMTGGIYDSTVKIQAAAISNKAPNPKRVEAKPRSTPEALKVLRAMRLSEGLASADIAAFDALLFRDEVVEARTLYIYETPTLVGYICRLSNRSDETLRVDLTRFAGSGLVASATREFIVKAKGETILYFVYRRQ